MTGRHRSGQRKARTARSPFRPISIPLPKSEAAPRCRAKAPCLARLVDATVAESGSDRKRDGHAASIAHHRPSFQPRRRPSPTTGTPGAAPRRTSSLRSGISSASRASSRTGAAASGPRSRRPGTGLRGRRRTEAREDRPEDERSRPNRFLRRSRRTPGLPSQRRPVLAARSPGLRSDTRRFAARLQGRRHARASQRVRENRIPNQCCRVRNKCLPFEPCGERSLRSPPFLKRTGGYP